VAIDLADKDGKSWAKITATGTGDGTKPAADLSTEVTPWIYALPGDKAKTLRDKIDDLVEAPPAKGS
jgi:hypothetical protein